MLVAAWLACIVGVGLDLYGMWTMYFSPHFLRGALILILGLCVFGYGVSLLFESGSEHPDLVTYSLYFGSAIRGIA